MLFLIFISTLHTIVELMVIIVWEMLSMSLQSKSSSHLQTIKLCMRGQLNIAGRQWSPVLEQYSASEWKLRPHSPAQVWAWQRTAACPAQPTTGPIDVACTVVASTIDARQQSATGQSALHIATSKSSQKTREPQQHIAFCKN